MTSVVHPSSSRCRQSERKESPARLLHAITFVYHQSLQPWQDTLKSSLIQKHDACSEQRATLCRASACTGEVCTSSISLSHVCSPAATGNIVVDGVAASIYNDAMAGGDAGPAGEARMHAFTALGRALWRSAPAVLRWAHDARAAQPISIAIGRFFARVETIFDGDHFRWLTSPF